MSVTRSQPAAPDHVVIDVRFSRDEAVHALTRLGFAPTARGYHSLGSINHLMVFEHNCLKLTGLRQNTEIPRQEIVARPTGFDGLALRTTDAEAMYRGLRAGGLEAEPPLSFSRPVQLEGRGRLADFRTLRLEAEWFEAGRGYVSEHLTPDPVARTPTGCGAEHSGKRQPGTGPGGAWATVWRPASHGSMRW